MACRECWQRRRSRERCNPSWRAPRAAASGRLRPKCSAATAAAAWSARKPAASATPSPCNGPCRSATTDDVIPEALREAVRRATGSGGVAAFDADGTLWREDVGEAFLRHLVALGWVRLPDGSDPYEEYERRVDQDKRSGYVFAAQLQAGLAVADVEAEADRFAREWVPPRLIPQ